MGAGVSAKGGCICGTGICRVPALGVGVGKLLWQPVVWFCPDTTKVLVGSGFSPKKPQNISLKLL